MPTSVNPSRATPNTTDPMRSLRRLDIARQTHHHVRVGCGRTGMYIRQAPRWQYCQFSEPARLGIVKVSAWCAKETTLDEAIRRDDGAAGHGERGGVCANRPLQ